jgi:hypothetical protein
MAINVHSTRAPGSGRTHECIARVRFGVSATLRRVFVLAHKGIQCRTKRTPVPVITTSDV